MTKQPFTADGVTAKISELQDLPDDTLWIETQSMRTDFQSWMLSNFSMDSKQSGYLLGMDPRFIKSLSEDLADCMQFHLPLYVTFGPVYIGAKFVKERSDLIRINGHNGYQVTGQLRIEIIYERQ